MKIIKHFLSLFFLFSVSLFSFSQENIDLLLLNKNYDQAIRAINEKLDVHPDASLYFKKGIAYSNLQNYQEALNAYSEALLLDPNNVDIISEMAENLSTLGNQQDAEEFYKKAVQLDPRNLTLKAKLGRVYINQKKIRPAYDIFSQIYAVDSSNIYWNKQLAFCSFQIGKRLTAVHLYEKVLEANPRDFSTYINLIHTYSRNKEADSIVGTINKGLEQFPGNAELILEQANFYFKTKDYETARKSFEDYFAARGDSIYEIIMNYAISTYFSGDENGAMEILEDLFLQNPNDPFVSFYMGLCYKKLVNYPEAEKFMQWAIDESLPDYLPDIYHHLGQIYGLDRKFEESISALKKVNELDPTDHEILFEIATTYEEFNNNKTIALNYYRLYLKEAGESAKNMDYALERITKIKEDMFFDE